MKRAVSLSPKARDDLLRLVDFLGDKNSRVADTAFDAISDGLLSLANMPERGRSTRRAGLREIRIHFGRGGYVILYRIDPETVVVARIFHARERR